MSEAAIDSVRAGLLASDERLRAPRPRAHLTLSAAEVELGGELERLSRVVARLADRHGRLAIELDEVGRFGRALWFGMSARPAALDELQRDAYTALVDAGWPPAFGAQSDPRRWLPHCTIARNARRVPPARFAPVVAEVDRLITILLGRGEVASVRLGRTGYELA